MSKNRDTVSIRDLQLPLGVIAPNVWGDDKPQPALVSIQLGLRQGIDSAADKDALDQNTVHYGELAKRVRAAYDAEHTIDELRYKVQREIRTMSMREDETCRLLDSKINILLPKASMYGEGVQVEHIEHFRPCGANDFRQQSFRLLALKVMALLGVNAYERRALQPLIVDLELTLGDGGALADLESLATLFQVEQSLVQYIQASSFETLEALADSAFKDLEQMLVEGDVPCEQIRLKLDKPRAIAFAECPSVEILRQVRRQTVID